MTCITCGRRLEPGARSCPRCGAPVPEPVPVPEPADTPVLARPIRPAPAAPEPRRAGTGPLLATAVLALLALVGGGWLLLTRDPSPPSHSAVSAPSSASPQASRSPSPSPSPSASPSPTATPTPDALAQARAQDALLDRTASSKDAVGQAVSALTACTITPQEAQSVFEQAAAGRRSLLTELGGLELDGLPEGPDLRAALTTVLQSSAEADDAFAAWAAKQASGCVPDPNDADLTRGLQLSADTARPAKESFVALWNPVAARYGLPPRTADAL